VRRSARLKMDTGVDEEKNGDTAMNPVQPSGYDGDREDIERVREAIKIWKKHHLKHLQEPE
jgi:hypothetical protein